jgi:hypothetical protein
MEGSYSNYAVYDSSEEDDVEFINLDDKVKSIKTIDVTGPDLRDSVRLNFSITIPTTVPTVEAFEELYEKRRLIHQHGTEVHNSLSRDLLNVMKQDEESRQQRDSKEVLSAEEEAAEIELSAKAKQEVERRNLLREYSANSLSRRNSDPQLLLPEPRELKMPINTSIPVIKWPTSRRPKVLIESTVKDGMLESIDYFNIAAGQRIAKKSSKFEPRIVYDNERKMHSTPYSTRTQLDKTLQFESRFESGNLGKLSLRSNLLLFIRVCKTSWQI